ncbi:hypothetical protein BDR04DRAFT_1201495 [Suillus decipiens]|nr:hypothetical protein BDR04DRAFT_1201495 [Suillus decipiens]
MHTTHPLELSSPPHQQGQITPPPNMSRNEQNHPSFHLRMPPVPKRTSYLCKRHSPKRPVNSFSSEKITPHLSLISRVVSAIFVCPTYYLISPFGKRAWKGEFAIPPGLHETDIAYLPPLLRLRLVSLPTTIRSSITAFLNLFMATMATFETPDHRYTPGDITPSWSSWQDNEVQREIRGSTRRSYFQDR